MFFDEDLDEDSIAEYLATAGTKEREEYLEGLNILRSRFFGGTQVGGGEEDNIIEYYSKIMSDTDTSKRMIDMVLDFANEKGIMLGQLSSPAQIGKPTPIKPTPITQKPSIIATQAKQPQKPDVNALKTQNKNLNKTIYEQGFESGKVASTTLSQYLSSDGKSSVTDTPDPTVLSDINTFVTSLTPKQGANFLNANDFTPYFKFIQIPGDGNCLFNSIAWWILQYNTLSPPSFPSLNAYTNKNDYNAIFTFAPFLRAMVCGFYDGYSNDFIELERMQQRIMDSDLKGKYRILRAIFIGYEAQANYENEPIEHCLNEYNSGIDEAVILSYILKFNLYTINMAHGKRASAQYFNCGESDRPTIIILKQNGAHWDVLYPNNEKSIPLIAPLKLDLNNILENAAKNGYQAYATAKSDREPQ